MPCRPRRHHVAATGEHDRTVAEGHRCQRRSRCCTVDVSRPPPTLSEPSPSHPRWASVPTPSTSARGAAVVDRVRVHYWEPLAPKTASTSGTTPASPNRQRRAASLRPPPRPLRLPKAPGELSVSSPPSLHRAVASGRLFSSSFKRSAWAVGSLSGGCMQPGPCMAAGRRAPLGPF
jgi:hypothetical protein